MKQGTILRKVRIFWHNITTSEEDNITAPINKGIIYGRRTKRKVFLSIVFSGSLSFIFMFFPHSIPIPIEVILFFTKTAIVYTGFISAFLFERLYAFISSMFKTVDKIESGELDVEKEVTEVINGAVGIVQETIKNGFKEDKPIEQLKEPPKEIIVDDTNPEHDDAYYQKKLKDFGKD